MNANAELIPEHSYMETRIQRAYDRMMIAKKTEWRYAWGDLFCVLVRARNAMRTVAEVRAIEKARGL